MFRALLVTLLAFAAAVSFAEVIDLEGTVKAVDVSARTITIERKTAKGTKTLELEVTKKAGDLSSVEAGDSISFSYDPDLEIVTKIGNEADHDEPQVDRKGAVVDQKLLRKAFAASRAAYDPKTGVLTLGYDFKKRDQLKDFDVSNATPELGGNGTLRIGPGDTLPHVARFRTGQASFKVKFEKVDIPFLTAGPYQLRYDGGYYTRKFRMRVPGGQTVETDVGKTDPVEGGEAGKVYTVSLLIGERRCTLKVVGNNNTKECGVVAAPGEAFGFTFDGNTHGVTIGDLQLQGEADPEWLQSLFQK